MTDVGLHRAWRSRAAARMPSSRVAG